MKPLPGETRAVYRAAERWGIAGIKWRANRNSRWYGAGACANFPLFTDEQEKLIREMLRMEGESYERR